MSNQLVIMAGGVGSRFWPMSTPEKPKQFIDVLGCGKSLLQMTVERFKGIVDMKDVWVVTNKDYKFLVKEQIPTIPNENVLCEPCRRNTAPCIAYVSGRIKKQDPQANIIVTPSDHVVTDVIEFQRIVKSCLTFAAKDENIVTIGIKPSRPETGYGYIESEKAADEGIFKVAAFKEKPNYETAVEYIKHDNFHWNAGIFIWNVNTIEKAFEKYEPKLAQQFEAIADVFGTDREQDAIDKMYPECDNISVDYAIMEKADNIYVCPADFGWSDLGTWGSLLTKVEKDENGNGVIGNNVSLHETSNCVVHTSQEKRVVLQGLDGYIVAENDDTLLVCKLDQEQRIKEFV